MPTTRPKRPIRDVKTAPKVLVARRDPKAIRALPKIVKSVKRTASMGPGASAPSTVQGAKGKKRR